MNTSIVNELPEDDWRDFVDTHRDGNIFHTPEMFQVFNQARGIQPELWAATKGRRILALFLPVRVTLINQFLLRKFTTRSIVFGSVLSTHDSEGHDALAQMLQVYKDEVKGPPMFTELRSLSNLEVLQPILQEQGFFYEDHLNYLIDLEKPAHDIMHLMSKSGRKAIRRSIQSEVIPEEIQERSQIPAYYSLLEQTYKRAMVPLADISLFEAVYSILVPKGMAKMLLARSDGQLAAASLELPYKDTIFSWYSGYDRTFRKFYPNDRLVWHILEWGANNGFSCFDFGGAGRPTEKYGPREFKAKFGGKLVNFGRNTYVHAPYTLSISRTVYQKYRALFLYPSLRKR